MTKDEALKLALESLKNMLEDAKQERLTVEYWNQCVDAITAIKQARALDKMAAVVEPHKNARELGLDYEPVPEPDYWPGTKPVQEPVAWVRLEAWQSGAEWPDDCFTGIPADGFVPLYTTPPNVATPLAAQRPEAKPHKWVGLTDEEILKLAYPIRWQEVDDFEADKAVNFAQTIEAKLKDKNT